MATTVPPQGRMTKPLVTRFSVGDRVIVVADLYVDCEPPKRRIQVGETVTIRRIEPSAPNDGDATFLVFDIKSSRRLTMIASESEIAYPHEAEPLLWLRRQLVELGQWEPRS